MSTRPAVLQTTPPTPSRRASRGPASLIALCVLRVLRVSSDPPFSAPPPALGALSHRRIISEVIPQPAPILTRPNPFRMRSSGHPMELFILNDLCRELSPLECAVAKKPGGGWSAQIVSARLILVRNAHWSNLKILSSRIHFSPGLALGSGFWNFHISSSHSRTLGFAASAFAFFSNEKPSLTSITMNIRVPRR